MVIYVDNEIVKLWDEIKVEKMTIVIRFIFDVCFSQMYKIFVKVNWPKVILLPWYKVDRDMNNNSSILIFTELLYQTENITNI